MTEQDTALAASLDAQADNYYRWANYNIKWVQPLVDDLREAAERLRGLTAPLDELTALRQRVAELEHHEALIEAQSRRGITDCSTPLFIRVQNMREELERHDTAPRPQEDAPCQCGHPESQHLRRVPCATCSCGGYRAN